MVRQGYASVKPNKNRIPNACIITERLQLQSENSRHIVKNVNKWDGCAGATKKPATIERPENRTNNKDKRNGTWTNDV